MRLTFTLIFSLVTLLVFGQEKRPAVFYGDAQYGTDHYILDLSWEDLHDFPVQALSPSIHVLILDHNNLKDIPNNITAMKNLRTLSLRDNDLQSVNQVLELCENLEELYLNNNPNLRELPYALANCKKLRLIDVSNTGIHQPPAWLRGMSQLYYFKYTKIVSPDKKK